MLALGSVGTEVPLIIVVLLSLVGTLVLPHTVGPASMFLPPDEWISRRGILVLLEGRPDRELAAVDGAHDGGVEAAGEDLSDGELQLYLGFSDELSLEPHERVVFESSNTFAGFGSHGQLGYAYPGMSCVSQIAGKGVHRLTASLKVTGVFGWGMVLALGALDVQLLPAGLISTAP